MSNAVFPSNLPGLGWSVLKQPSWSTRIQKAVSGKELRAALMSYPLYRITLTYEVLRESAALQELQTLMGFFNARLGSFDSFLYSDPTDHSVTDQGFGTGTGTLAQFQLIRSYGGFAEPVMNLNGAPAIKVAGSLKTAGTDYTVDQFGVVTFTSNPPAGAALTWSGSFYYRCRFNSDSTEFDNFMYQLWQLKKLELWGSLGSKI